MATITVSPAILREKARLIRALLDESKATHQQLWTQISEQAGMLPGDLAAAHVSTNNPWSSAVESHYDNYYKLAINMEKAADAYERGDHTIQNLFDTF